MNRHSIRLTSFILALFVFILIFQNAIVKQQRLPFNTKEQFTLNISNTSATKEELIFELDNIADKYNAVLVKVVTDPNNYENKKDIIYFGNGKPDDNDIVVKNDKIYWLDSKLKGEIVSSQQIENRPLYGTYSMNQDENMKKEISQWAYDNGISIEWSIEPPLIKSIYYNLVHNGIGNVILTAFLLFVSSLISWFVLHAKGRSIRLLGGVNSKKIHIEDTVTISRLFVLSFIMALVTFLGYVGITKGINQIPLVTILSVIVLVAMILASYIITFLISVIVKPKIKLIASRTIPLKKFNQLGTVTRIISIFLALLIIPSTLTSAYILQQLSKEYSLWEKMQNNVSLSFGDLDSLGTDKMLPSVDKFFQDMENNANFSLSLVIDKSILLNNEEYGGYDHIIIADKSWVSSFDIGIETNKAGGKLEKKTLNLLDKPLQDFLVAQMPLWTKTKEVKPKGIDFYEFSGNKFLALPPNVGYGGSTVQAKHPLVILVDKPTETLNVLGFLLPACSSGNIVFPNEELLRTELNKSSIKEFVISIDTIADVALEQAQKFAKEAVFYVIACILIFVSMVFAGILTAQLWVSSNKKRIFTLHTFGKTYKEIIGQTFIHDLAAVILTIIVGCLVSFFIRHPEIATLSFVAVFILLLYGISSTVSYQIYARQAFYKVSSRCE